MNPACGGSDLGNASASASASAYGRSDLGSARTAARDARAVLLAVCEAPAEREQAAQLRARGRVVADVAPRKREVEAALHLVRFAEGDLGLRALVATAMHFSLGEVLR